MEKPNIIIVLENEQQLVKGTIKEIISDESAKYKIIRLNETDIKDVLVKYEDGVYYRPFVVDDKGFTLAYEAVKVIG